MLSRIRAAWEVLMGQRLVPFQIQAEWVQYQQIFQGQMEMFSSYLARSAKAEKARLKRITDDLGEQPAAQAVAGMTREQRKAELRARMSGRQSHQDSEAAG